MKISSPNWTAGRTHAKQSRTGRDTACASTATIPTINLLQGISQPLLISQNRSTSNVEPATSFKQACLLFLFKMKSAWPVTDRSRRKVPTAWGKSPSFALHVTVLKARNKTRNRQASQASFRLLMPARICQPRIPNFRALFATRTPQSSATQSENGPPV